MSQTEGRADKAEKSAPSNLIPPELAAMGKKRLDELVAMQTEQLAKIPRSEPELDRPDAIACKTRVRVCHEAYGGSLDA